MECIEKKLNFYPYVDPTSGVDNLDIEPPGFKCTLSKEGGHCGMGFSFNETENWNLMDFVTIDMQSSADFEELIVQILTIDPHTKETDRSTMKPLIKELKLEQNKKRYPIPIEHFYTPDYWFEQQKVKETNNSKRFSAVAGMEIYSGWKNKIDKSLELKIEGICLEGVSNTRFVILVIYIGILIATAISVRIKT
ncbi:MAG: hypothetical protein LBC75_01230 [Fibromonadaceae bacterium]|nr:hypothetical protein [Fibromonadaceae bacterium]